MWLALSSNGCLHQQGGSVPGGRRRLEGQMNRSIPDIPEVFRYFSSKMCAVFLKEGYIFFLKGWSPMMFELVLDVTNRFLNLRDTNAECAIASLPRRV
jgi:hypothetical protein